MSGRTHLPSADQYSDYADGLPFDFTVCNTAFLYSQAIGDTSVLDPYLNTAADLFFAP